MLKTSFVGVRRSLVALAATAATAVALLGASPAAQAQPATPDYAQSSSDLSFDDVLNDTRENAWNSRNAFLKQVSESNPEAASQIRPVLDSTMDVVFPGLRAQKEREEKARLAAIEKARQAEVAAEKARAEEAARKAEAERKRREFNVGPCPADADVCVDLDGRRTWLQNNGNITYVAPSMAPGKAGQETPRGTFHVNRKVKDEISYEFNNAPMPYAIYFTNNGHAFHMGNPAYDSAGCVRLPEQAALRYWDNLHVGDKVFIY
ncbi:MAG: L,D-transpeptidase [Corynebacterium casei]|uniref:L,D-transpeptidase n=3 Tax=Corynebacterium casei TaxID=160386 RepID=UPI0026495EEC|nr:L,D-transpeptidase [Corynebacterium casei]MDN5729681.1 L,D-transpeptidase [Corynebacterium casei]MDN5739574.1 L,D-transpeptidase [Corynebacterium casei]MDN5798681.1 L,D-transpeptidase [Corynebacterium casei]MDN5826101.1 L,D-transpeptidase [Corynebacterium casei]MDN5840669.1 L,D-transpeptidase [Corynebacterium casei]